MSERVQGALAQAGKAAASPEAALGDRPASLERGAMALLPSFPSLPADRGPGVQRQTYQHFRSPDAGPGGVCVDPAPFRWPEERLGKAGRHGVWQARRPLQDISEPQQGSLGQEPAAWSLQGFLLKQSISKSCW